MPPAFCASAITCSVMVVLPDDSGPNTSITRPRGKPPTPSAASKEMDPVEITAMGTIASFDPRRMIEPLPNCFSICAKANSIALPRSSAMGVWLLKVLNLYGPDYIPTLKRNKSENIKYQLENFPQWMRQSLLYAAIRDSLPPLLGFQADCDLHHRTIGRIDLEHCFAGVARSVQPIHKNAES